MIFLSFPLDNNSPWLTPFGVPTKWLFLPNGSIHMLICFVSFKFICLLHLPENWWKVSSHNFLNRSFRLSINEAMNLSFKAFITGLHWLHREVIQSTALIQTHSTAPDTFKIMLRHWRLHMWLGAVCLPFVDEGDEDQTQAIFIFQWNNMPFLHYHNLTSENFSSSEASRKGNINWNLA